MSIKNGVRVMRRARTLAADMVPTRPICMRQNAMQRAGVSTVVGGVVLPCALRQGRRLDDRRLNQLPRQAVVPVVPCPRPVLPLVVWGACVRCVPGRGNFAAGGRRAVIANGVRCASVAVRAKFSTRVSVRNAAVAVVGAERAGARRRGLPARRGPRRWRTYFIVCGEGGGKMRHDAARSRARSSRLPSERNYQLVTGRLHQ